MANPPIPCPPNPKAVRVSPEIKKEINEKLNELSILLMRSGTEILYDQDFGNTYLLPQGYVVDNNEDPEYPGLVDLGETYTLSDLEPVSIPLVPYCPNYHTIVKP